MSLRPCVPRDSLGSALGEFRRTVGAISRRRGSNSVGGSTSQAVLSEQLNTEYEVQGAEYKRVACERLV